MMSDTPVADLRAEDRLAHLPISLFAMVMGLAGLSIAYFRFSAIMPVAWWGGVVIALLASAVFVLLSTLYATKFARFPDAVRAEFNHPVKLNFFPAITIGTLLLSVALNPVAPGFTKILFLVAAPCHLVLTLVVLSQWFNGTQFQPGHINPAWFIPIVGNILVPIPAEAFGYGEIGWLFFAIGLVFWPVLLTLFVHRMLFQPALPPRLMPTIFILIPPPAIGFVSYVKLAPGLDNFGRLLYFTAVFMTMLVWSQFNRLRSLPFFVSWWAYSFPMAAITIATLVMHDLTGAAIYRTAAMALLTLTSIVIAGLSMRTIIAAMRDEICVPE